ncbi:LOW QUALITY PROTEIN: myosin light chain kinase family member 4 [Sceloporus undulatus]|uniref:LOW QUALITY PROTEIN: myosin light chain kinase family member 4 n=1 Tax=Sceloporus undulatus TaxID=8520 RepID=UPI001C4A90F7|nr:LOW QUALITY PROTEIN: myosin light chain kinase family member 4 [Sceloporus undulatus]
MTTSSKKTSSSSVVNSLAKIFDPNALKNQHPAYEEEPSPIYPFPREDTSCPENMNGLDVKVVSLDQKINTLLTMQNNVLQKLDCVSQEIYSMGENIELLKGKGKNSGVGVSTVTSEKSDVSILCIEINKKLSDMSKNAEQQSKRLDGLEHIVLGIQQLVGSLVEKLKTSTITDLMRRNETSRKFLRVGGYLRKDRSGNLFRMQTFSDKKELLFSKWNEKEKYLTAKGTKPTIKKKKPPDSSEESDDTGKVHQLNKENTEKASPFFVQKVSSKSLSHELKGKAEESHWTSPLQKTTEKSQAEANAKETSNKQSALNTKGDTLGLGKRNEESEESSEGLEKDGQRTDANRDDKREELETISQSDAPSEDVDSPSKSQDHNVEHKHPGKASFPLKDEDTTSSKRLVLDKKIAKDVNKKSRVDVGKINDGLKSKEPTKSSKVEPSVSDKKGGSNSEAKKKKEHQETSIENICVIDDSPPPPAPFDHRIVSAKRMGINSFYHVHKGEVLGGGRFGQVHKCEEKSTGLTLAAKIIKARGVKEKDEVKNEINVMNQLNHVNLIQLYDAFESKNDIILVMEYVEGGELFDRIIDENYNLSEMDTILFTKQICEGIQYMHQMYILHLDLKPENILCVNRQANQIKIIDFGLARRYKPREKLKVNFGTPEFLAPEVVNYDFVSFPTDMWSVGIIAYMLLSGLSPFLGDDDNETLNNILACRWDFDDEEFAKVSEEAKDFISKLLIKEKGWRISATAALKHPWLSDQKLHSRLLTQKKGKGSSTSQAPKAP